MGNLNPILLNEERQNDRAIPDSDVNLSPSQTLGSQNLKTENKAKATPVQARKIIVNLIHWIQITISGKTENYNFGCEALHSEHMKKGA